MGNAIYFQMVVYQVTSKKATIAMLLVGHSVATQDQHQTTHLPTPVQIRFTTISQHEFRMTEPKNEDLSRLIHLQNKHQDIHRLTLSLAYTIPLYILLYALVPNHVQIHPFNFLIICVWVIFGMVSFAGAIECSIKVRTARKKLARQGNKHYLPQQSEQKQQLSRLKNSVGRAPKAAYIFFIVMLIVIALNATLTQPTYFHADVAAMVLWLLSLTHINARRTKKDVS